MWNKYIKFNNLSSLDFGLIINSIDIGCPTPKLITETIPFMNGSYDFSTVSSDGIQTFNDRTVVIKFSYKNINEISQYNTYFNATNWLLSANKGPLNISTVDGTFNGKCISCSKLSKSYFGGTFTATFSCDPLIVQDAFGDYIWNTFNFESGMAEINEFKFNAGDKLEIYCDSDSIEPILISNIDCEIYINGVEYNLSSGSNKIYGMIFNYGINVIEILTGNNGVLNINFRKDVV